MDLDTVARSFKTVVIGSGDGIFTPMVDQSNRLGLHTITVSWSEHLSRRLSMVSAEVRLLDRAQESQAQVLPLVA